MALTVRLVPVFVPENTFPVDMNARSRIQNVADIRANPKAVEKQVTNPNTLSIAAFRCLSSGRMENQTHRPYCESHHQADPCSAILELG